MEASLRKNSKFILTCTCTGQDKLATSAYQLLYKGETPEIYSGDKIRTLSDRYNGTNFGDYTRALAKNKARFMYFFEVAENGDVITQVNLKTGRKVC